MKKKKIQLSTIYLWVILALMYLPIIVIIVYSFNESKLSSTWDGFSLTWYKQLFRDRAMGEALINSLTGRN